MNKSSFHWRNLSRILRRIEGIGVVKRIRVPLQVNRKVTKTNTAEVELTEKCHARCIKYVRDMTPEDWRKLAAFSSAGGVQYDEDEPASDDEIDQAAKDGLEADPQAVQELADVDVDKVEDISRDRDLPLWNMNQPMNNIIHDIVDWYKTEGISSMDLMYRTVGSFYYRPMDQILHRMTDFPANSQPANFRNLAVIRETSISGRSTHYHYFSYPNHQTLVKDGLANEPWSVQEKGRKKGKNDSYGDGTASQVDIDQYGFPAPNTSRLLKKDGSAKLSESTGVIMKTDKVSGVENQFSAVVGKDGRKTIDWKTSGGKYAGTRTYCVLTNEKCVVGLVNMSRAKSHISKLNDNALPVSKQLVNM